MRFGFEKIAHVVSEFIALLFPSLLCFFFHVREEWSNLYFMAYSEYIIIVSSSSSNSSSSAHTPVPKSEVGDIWQHI